MPILRFPIISFLIWDLREGVNDEKTQTDYRAILLHRSGHRWSQSLTAEMRGNL